MGKKLCLVLIGIAALLVLAIAGLAIATAAGARPLAPIRLATHYPWNSLVDEAATIDTCVAAGCHKPADIHTCGTCHDQHGDAQLAQVPFASLLLLTGDVPEPGYIPINDILPYREITRTVMPLLDFLAQHGVGDFESATLSSSDGGFVTITRENLTPQSLLMPYADGVRFADEKLHASAWLKGIDRIVVVGREKPLRVDGQDTSIGRLLLGPTAMVTVEQTEVMLRSEEDGQIRRAQTAFRIEGVPLAVVVTDPAFTALLVRDAQGQERTLAAEEARGAVLAVVHGHVTLVLPGSGRGQWIGDVVEIKTER
jgi:hypothetical protein